MAMVNPSITAGLAASFVFLLVLLGCFRRSVDNESVRDATVLHEESKNTVDHFSHILHKGMSRSEVLEALGEPLIEQRLEDGRIELLFLEFPPKKLGRLELSGVKVYLSEDKVESWFPLYSRMGPAAQ